MKQLLLALVALIGGVLIGTAAGVRLSGKAQAQGVVSTDIASLRSAPAKYAGKLVRVGGKLDECYSWECSLCPATMTTATADAKQCLALDFRPLIPGTGFGGDEKEKVLRFSNVTLIGKFDPTCWNNPCLDRGTVLFDADVAAVQARHSSGDGLWLGRVTKLQEAPEPLAKEIVAQARSAGFPNGQPTKVFNVIGDPNVAVVCWMPAGNSWPTSLEAALYAKSTLDFYTCNEVHNAEGTWTVQVPEDS
ncbi:MAG: hypothetical protein ACTHJK_10600 [Sphingomicrobium sp.]